VAASTGIDAIPIRTNIWDLDGDGWFYSYKWHGAALASHAYFFSRYFGRVYIASSAESYSMLGPWGSHPLLDVRYSGAHLQIEHHGLHMERLEKLALIGDWPDGLNNLLVCQQELSGNTNCGRCEKCLWTMTALVALGKLDAAPSYAEDDVSPELLSTVQEYGMLADDEALLYQYETLIPALIRRGRHDLVQVIRQFRPAWELKTAEFRLEMMDATGLIPPGANFIVADREDCGYPVPSQRKGSYWAQPPDGVTAIRELENLREAGSDFLIFTHNALWWPDHYRGLRDHLWSNYQCLREDERFVIFDLRRKPVE
jgi:hypothetical protein